jgi:hypothetical protein
MGSHKRRSILAIPLSKTNKNLPQGDSGVGDEMWVYVQFQPRATARQ